MSCHFPHGSRLPSSRSPRENQRLEQHGRKRLNFLFASVIICFFLPFSSFSASVLIVRVHLLSRTSRCHINSKSKSAILVRIVTENYYPLHAMKLCIPLAKLIRGLEEFYRLFPSLYANNSTSCTLKKEFGQLTTSTGRHAYYHEKSLHQAEHLFATKESNAWLL